MIQEMSMVIVPTLGLHLVIGLEFSQKQLENDAQELPDQNTILLESNPGHPGFFICEMMVRFIYAI